VKLPSELVESKREQPIAAPVDGA